MRRAFVALVSALTLTTAAFACGDTLSVDETPGVAADGGPSNGNDANDSGADGGASDAGPRFCDGEGDASIFCTDFTLSPVETLWFGKDIADASSISLDLTASVSPPSSFLSVAGGSRGAATLTFQLPAKYDPFEIEFDFQAGPEAMETNAAGRIIGLELGGSTAVRNVDLITLTQLSYFTFAIQIGAANRPSPNPVLSNQWSHLRIEAARDTSIVSPEPVWNFDFYVENQGRFGVQIATTAQAKNEPFKIHLGVDKRTQGTQSNARMVNIRYDNFRIRRRLP